MRKEVELFLAEWRNLVCSAIIVAVPSLLAAQGTNRAILHNTGGTALNKNPAPATSAIFPDDLIETQKGNIATLEAEGSNVTIQPETVVQFEPDELDLDHGFLQLTTARELRVRVNCLTLIPLTANRTQYDVSDVDGKVKIVAYKNDVKIHARDSAARKLASQGKPDDSRDEIVHEGQQKIRDEHCGAAVKPEETVDAKAGILNTVQAKVAGLGGIALLCLLICVGDDPISPSLP